MYKDCSKFKKAVDDLQENFDEYVSILTNAQKIEDLQDIESVQISIGERYWECLILFDDGILVDHYKEWILNSKLNWGIKSFNYNSDTRRMEIDTIHLNAGSITYLPKRLTILSSLYLAMDSGNNLQDLPDDLIVEGTVFTWWEHRLYSKVMELYNKGQIKKIIQHKSNEYAERNLR